MASKTSLKIEFKENFWTNTQLFLILIGETLCAIHDQLACWTQLLRFYIAYPLSCKGTIWSYLTITANMSTTE